MKAQALSILILLTSISAMAQKSAEERGWNQPVEPFKIAGNLYYVGASDVTSYLITTPKGHILIDSGFIETVPQINANVLKLGFKLEDVKVLLSSHAHYDHTGGLAELKRLTGARLMASEADAALLANGGLNDPNFGDRFPFEPVRADETFNDGKKIQLGGTTLTANITPGHTRGCTTWTTKVKDSGQNLNVIFVCSTSAPGYKLVGNENYPSIYSDYMLTFMRLERLKPDIFLGAHGGIYDLEGKLEKLRNKASVNPFIDPKGYRDYLKDSKASLDAAYKKQSGK